MKPDSTGVKQRHHHLRASARSIPLSSARIIYAPGHAHTPSIMRRTLDESTQSPLRMDFGAVPRILRGSISTVMSGSHRPSPTQNGSELPGAGGADICTRPLKSVDRAWYPSVYRLVSSRSPPPRLCSGAYHDAG